MIGEGPSKMTSGACWSCTGVVTDERGCTETVWFSTGVVLSSTGVVLSSTGVVFSSACRLFTMASGAGSISSSSSGPFLPFRLLDLGLTFLLRLLVVLITN